ncbi:MAG: hypothetical protein ACD_73C00551G0004 [uncultured bacterium]|nr:MAG: hypothetical protein ACD_73C00551G0004 [uncultured bacterium]
MFILEQLPYSKDALQNVISRETLEYHHDKHHQGYVNNLNKLIVGTEFEKISLEEIVKKSAGSIFNNAAQVWNHNFYWNSLTPEKQTGPNEALTRAVEKDFGSFSEFEKQFEETSHAIFGSGWAWLVKDGSQLKIQASSNAMNPLKTGGTPLFVCDVWEHAYYIDYRHNRDKYISEFWKILNWHFVEENYIPL